MATLNLTFYIKPTTSVQEIIDSRINLKRQELKDSQEKPSSKSYDKIYQDEMSQAYGQIDIELLPIKSEANTGLRQMHYSKAMDELLSRVGQIHSQQEEGEGMRKEKKPGYLNKYKDKKPYEKGSMQVRWDQKYKYKGKRPEETEMKVVEDLLLLNAA